MKKCILSIGFVCLIAVGILVQQKKTAAEYRKHETMLHHLKQKSFKKKLHSPPPSWMQKQIQEDFEEFAGQGVSKEAIDATFARIWESIPKNSALLRYRIIDNELYRYFSDGDVISFEDNSTEKAIKTLLQCTRFADMDFILSYYDGVGREDRFFHTLSSNLQAPILSSAKIKGISYVVLIPDWRSVGHWWMSDIKSIKTHLVAWEKKRNFAIWRGGLTKPIRLKLCQLSLLYPEYLDAKFPDLHLRGQIDAACIAEKRASWEELLSCKYLPYADGVMCAAPALQWRLLSNSVIFKPDSDEIQWFYGALQPYVHYVPVKQDLEDLIEKLEWAKSHDSFCKEIADNAAHFARNHLMYEDVLLYFSLVLKRYAELQTFSGDRLKQEVRKNSHWVKLQYREDIKKQAARGDIRRFQLEATPF